MGLAVKVEFDLLTVGKAIQGKVDSYTREVLEGVYNAVIFKTPVRTGNARIRWEKNDEQGIIWNDADYILKLENGSSKQAPNGMVRTTLEVLDSGGLKAVQAFGRQGRAARREALMRQRGIKKRRL